MDGKITTGLIDLLPAHGTVRKYEDKAEWLESRKRRMTGSKAASLFGLNEYLSVYRLWAIESGILEEPVRKDTGNMWRGRELEVPLLKWLAYSRGWDVEPWPQSWTLSHPETEGQDHRLQCTPDAIAIVRGVQDHEPFDEGELINVEVKTVNQWAIRYWERDADGSLIMPIEFQIQTQIELACLGLHGGVLILQPSFNPEDMVVIPYVINHAFLRRLMAMAADFWRLVDSGEEPPVDGSESTWQTLKRLYPEESGEAVMLPAESDVWAAEFAAAKEAERAAAKRKELAKNQLIAAIGDATYARTPGGANFSYKGRVSRRIDSKALRAAYPSIAAECEAVSEFRVLLPCKTIPEALLAEAMVANPLGETLGDDAA